MNDSYAVLRIDERAWNEELSERGEWDRVSMDDITDDEPAEAEPR